MATPMHTDNSSTSGHANELGNGNGNGVRSAWVVLKFGGTSVSTAARWQCICEQVQRHLAATAERRVWVTISAMSQVTNKLTAAIALARDHHQEQKQQYQPLTAPHLELVQRVVLQHFALAYEVGLFPACNGISDSVALHDHWQREWVRAVIGNHDDNTQQQQHQQQAHGAQPASGPIDASLPTALHPLLLEFRHLLRILEGVRLTEEASPRIQARVLAFGELLSTHLGIAIMMHYGVDSVSRVDARQLIISDSASAKSEEDRFLQAQVAPRADLGACEALSLGHRVVLTQGFIAATQEGATCLLGRGGSDTSGSLFAALLQAQKYEIWTDVHGMFTSDPRDVPDARLIKCLDYREAQELAAMGAKVLHPRCIEPARFAGIPLEIRNTNDPEGAKTVIQAPDISSNASSSTTNSSSNSGAGPMTRSSPKILAVVRRAEMTTLSITAFDMLGTSGFLAKVFAPFERFGISVDLIATSQFSVTVTLDHIPGGVEGAPFQGLLQALDQHSKVQVYESCSVVSIVGRGLRKSLGELGRVFDVLEGYDVLLLSESAEDLNLSFVLQQRNANEIVARMHRFFFPSDGQGMAASTGSTVGAATGGVTPVVMGSTIRRTSSRDALLGPTWQTLRASPRAGTPPA